MGVSYQEFEGLVECGFCKGKGDIFQGKPCWKCGKYAKSYYERVISASTDREAKLGDSQRPGAILSTQVAGNHYRYLKPQPIEVIESWNLGFHLGAALKYIARAGKKPGNSANQDIEKAIWFLKRYTELAWTGAGADKP